MVTEDITITKEGLQEDFNAQYWDNRYTLQASHVPTMFAPLATKILNTGKYLNVIRDCIGDYALIVNASSMARKKVRGGGGDELSSDEDSEVEDQADGNPFERLFLGPSPSSSSSAPDHRHNHHDPFIFHFTNQQSQQQRAQAEQLDASHPMRSLCLRVGDHSQLAAVFQTIESAYQLSSQLLLQLLMKGFSLQTHFESLGKFFLLEHGDFFIQFMDIAELDLRKEVKEIPIHRLHNLLSLAIQTSTLATDLHRENLSCSLASHNLIQHLHLIQVLSLPLHPFYIILTLSID